MTDKLKLFIREKLTFEEQNQLMLYVDDGNLDGINKFITDYNLLSEFQSILAETVRNDNLEFTSNYRFWTIIKYSTDPMLPGVAVEGDELKLVANWWDYHTRGEYVLFELEDLLKFIKTDVNNEIFEDGRYIRPFYIGNDVDVEKHEWNGITFYVTEPNDQKLDYQHGNRIQWDEDNLVLAIKYCFKMAIQIITRDAVTVSCKIKSIDVKKVPGKCPSWRATVHYKLTGESITQKTEEEWPSVELFKLPSTKLNKTSLLEDCCYYVIRSINKNYSIVQDTKIEREKNKLKTMIKEEYSKIGISNVEFSDSGTDIDVKEIKLIEQGIQYKIGYRVIEALLVDKEKCEKIDNVDLLIMEDLTPSTRYCYIEKSLEDNRRECQLVCSDIAAKKKVVTDELNSKYEEILANITSKKNELAELTTRLQEKIPDIKVGARMRSIKLNYWEYDYKLEITFESTLIKNGSYVVEHSLSSKIYIDELYAKILRKRIPQKSVNRKSTTIKGTEDKLFTFGDEGEEI